jgi:hypothetical protein
MFEFFHRQGGLYSLIQHLTTHCFAAISPLLSEMEILCLKWLGRLYFHAQFIIRPTSLSAQSSPSLSSSGPLVGASSSSSSLSSLEFVGGRDGVRLLFAMLESDGDGNEDMRIERKDKGIVRMRRWGEEAKKLFGTEITTELSLVR